eukprot:Nk52_evm1s496 gene=Nk52_evmTU1s496
MDEVLANLHDVGRKKPLGRDTLFADETVYERKAYFQLERQDADFVSCLRPALAQGDEYHEDQILEPAILQRLHKEYPGLVNQASKLKAEVFQDSKLQAEERRDVDEAGRHMLSRNILQFAAYACFRNHPSLPVILQRALVYSNHLLAKNQDVRRRRLDKVRYPHKARKQRLRDSRIKPLYTMEEEHAIMKDEMCAAVAALEHAGHSAWAPHHGGRHRGGKHRGSQHYNGRQYGKGKRQRVDTSADPKRRKGKDPADASTDPRKGGKRE